MQYYNGPGSKRGSWQSREPYPVKPEAVWTPQMELEPHNSPSLPTASLKLSMDKIKEKLLSMS